MWHTLGADGLRQAAKQHTMVWDGLWQATMWHTPSYSKIKQLGADSLWQAAKPHTLVVDSLLQAATPQTIARDGLWPSIILWLSFFILNFVPFLLCSSGISHQGLQWAIKWYFELNILGCWCNKSCKGTFREYFGTTLIYWGGFLFKNNLITQCWGILFLFRSFSQ